MGEFSSGPWIVMGSLYFFFMFIIISATLAAGNDTGIDMGDMRFRDPGFDTLNNDPSMRTGECRGLTTGLCSTDVRATGNTTCEFVTGCVFSLVNTFPSCIGRHAFECPSSNQTMCQVLTGCSWYSYTGEDADTTTRLTEDSFDWGTVKETIGVMTGFDRGLTIGIPPAWNWIFSFLFIWIPFFMLLWSVYMAIPFLH